MRSKLFERGRLRVRVSLTSSGVMFTTPACTPSCPDDSFSGQAIPLDLWQEIVVWVEEVQKL
jgi:hypothetical protein